MVMDSSAVIAILLRESEADAFTAAIHAAPSRLIGAPSYLETSIVLIGRLGPPSRGGLDRLVASLGAEIVPFTPGQASHAIEAFLRYGKGRQHSAGLNFGDCCSYALAAETGLPLLFKGSDFSVSDIRPALVP
jgi:ribonuclease VapC